jgi:hypothetical protein
MNSEIRTLAFQGGTTVATPPTGDFADKATLTNNSANTITDLAWFLSTVKCAIIDYYIYRRTDSSYKWMKGTIAMVGVSDAATNATKWDFVEISRVEQIADMGITFSLTSVDTEKSALVATLDNMAGANHACTMYFDVRTLLA